MGVGKWLCASKKYPNRKLLWDESNRLRVVSDERSMQHYIYDASGERVLKASSDMEAVYQNGSLLNNPGSVSINGYTSYPSAFLVITADGVYSKHYYAGTQRIVSRLGDTDASLFEVGCGTCKEQSTPKDLDAKKLQQDQKADLQLYADQLKKGTIAYKEYKPTPLAEQEKALLDEQTPPNEQRAVAPPSGVGGLIYYYHPDHLGTSTALTDYFGNAYQFFLNLPFGETMAQQLGSNYYNSPYKFNGKELDEETGFYYYGARYYDPRISIFQSVDPLVEQTMDAYGYCYQNPINLIDPTGMSSEDPGDYYTKDGTYLGWDGKNDGKVYIANKYKHDNKTGKNIINNSDRTELKGVTNEVLLGFASVIHAESGGSKEESYAIGNVTMNFIDEGGSTQIPTLEDAVMYDNKFAQGATQENFTSFLGSSYSDRNSKYAVGAAINAIGFSQGLAGYSDYSNGADSWDGIDLVSTKWENTHRDYIWSEDSKDLLSTYKKNNNGGINVSGFTYKKSGFDISTTKIIGKTLFTNLNTGRGEAKQSTTRFNYKL